MLPPDSRLSLSWRQLSHNSCSFHWRNFSLATLLARATPYVPFPAPLRSQESPSLLQSHHRARSIALLPPTPRLAKAPAQSPTLLHLPRARLARPVLLRSRAPYPPRLSARLSRRMQADPPILAHRVAASCCPTRAHRGLEKRWCVGFNQSLGWTLPGSTKSSCSALGSMARRFTRHVAFLTMTSA